MTQNQQKSYHFKSIKENTKSKYISKEEVLSKLDQKEIYEYYFGNLIDLSKTYNSPFRRDRTPSFGFYIDRQGRLIGNDFKTDGFHGDCFSFVMNAYNCNFQEALQHIRRDFNLGTRPKLYENVSTSYKKKEVKISIKVKNFNRFELEFWNQFNITKPLLSKFNVYSVEQLYLNGKLSSVSTSTDPIFAFYFPKTDKLKIYRPFNKKYKWLSNTSKQDIFGLDQLDFTCNHIIVTSSLKDLMTLSSLNYNCIAPQSEVTFFDEEGLNIIRHFSNKGILFDNDAAGMEASDKLYAQINREDTQILILPEIESKDPSDYCKNSGIDALDFFMKKTFKIVV